MQTKQKMFWFQTFFTIFATLLIGGFSAYAGALDDHTHDHDHAKNPLVLDVSLSQKVPLDFHHTHFKQDKGFDSASAAFQNFCRDRIDGEVPQHDYTELFNRIKAVVGYFEGKGHDNIKVNVVSCFRSEKSNGIIRAKSIKRNGGKTGVAKKSQHTHGTAMDFFLTSNGEMLSISETVTVSCALARRAGGGGVGKYAGWVHLDTRDSMAQWGGANCQSNDVNALLAMF